ncbi:MAG: tetratricopeptide repeat protein [Saprospiraceae bacterium]|nr:tetratricopeptide repeat protein [Saprospiraceae bacterium]
MTFPAAFLPARFLFLIVLWWLTFAFSCDNAPRPDSTSHAEPRTDTYEELAQINAAARLNQTGDSFFETGEYLQAMAAYRQSMDSAAVQADSFLFYDSKLDLACVHERLGEPTKAIEIAEPVVDAFTRGGDSTRIGRAYSTLSGFYSRAGMHEKGRAASQKGFDILKTQGSLIHRCAAYNQMAFTFSDRDQWAEALPLLDTALQLMEASGILNQRPGMHLNLGDCHRRLGHWKEARYYVESAIAGADSLGQVHVHARALERLSQIEEATGNPVAALDLFRQAKQIRDSIFSEDKNRSLQELQVKYEAREKEQEIQLLRVNDQLQLAQRNLLFAGLVFVAGILGLGLFVQRQKLQNAHSMLAMRQQELEEYVQVLLEKNKQISALENSPTRRVAGKPEFEEEYDMEGENLYNSRILTDKDWETFKYRFGQQYPGYLQRLRERFPDLSGSEERLFLLMKINLTGQEIADILGITPNGVKKSRQRLRKRLGLNPEEQLDDYVVRF